MLNRLLLLTFLVSLVLISSYVIKEESDHSIRYKKLYDVEDLSTSDLWKTPPLSPNRDYKISGGTMIVEEQNSVQAVSFVDRYSSWFDNNIENEEETFNHVKYLFNLYQYGTNTLNYLIKENSLSYADAIAKRDSINVFVRNLQETYNKEYLADSSDENKMYWEYKIDSLVQTSKLKLAPKSSISGVNWSCYKSVYDDNFLNRHDDAKTINLFSKRNMELGVETHYGMIYHIDKNNFKDYIDEDIFKNIEIEEELINNYPAIKISAEKKESDILLTLYFIAIEDRTYEFFSAHPKGAKYEKITTNFINSFKLNNDHTYWKEYYEKNISKKVENITPIDNQTPRMHFLNSDVSDFSVAYSFPFKHEEKLIIPFQPVRHDLDEIDQILTIVNNEKKFTNKMDSLYQMIPIDLKELKPGKNRIQIGYIPKEKDSIYEKHVYYNNHLDFENE